MLHENNTKAAHDEHSPYQPLSDDQIRGLVNTICGGGDAPAEKSEAALLLFSDIQRRGQIEAVDAVSLATQAAFEAWSRYGNSEELIRAQADRLRAELQEFPV